MIDAARATVRCRGHRRRASPEAGAGSPSPQPTSSTREPGARPCSRPADDRRDIARAVAAPRPLDRAQHVACGTRQLAHRVCPARNADLRRLEEGARDVPIFRLIEQEGIVALVGLDLGKRHARATGVERVHDGARLHRREQPIAGERHDAEARARAAERFRQHAAVSRRRDRNNPSRASDKDSCSRRSARRRTSPDGADSFPLRNRHRRRRSASHDPASGDRTSGAAKSPTCR